jgi:hypothetical protein
MRRGDWPIRRIVKLHLGEDGVVRVVTIRSCHGYYKRPVVKVAKIVLNDGLGESNGNAEPKPKQLPCFCTNHDIMESIQVA